MEVSLEFENLHVDGHLRDHDDALLRFCGDLRIIVHGRPLYRHNALPILEFALSLAKWLTVADDRGPKFVYTSMESDVPGLVEFRAEVSGKWRISARAPSGDREHVSEVHADAGSVRQASESLLQKLGADIRLFFDPADYLTGPELLLLRRFWS